MPVSFTSSSNHQKAWLSMSLCLKSSPSATACHQNFVRCNKTLLLHCITRKVFECIHHCRNFQNSAWQLCVSVCTSNDGVDGIDCGIDCFQQRKRGSYCCGVCSPTWKDSLQIRQGFFWLIWMVDQYLKCPWCLHGRDFTLADMIKQEYQSTDETTGLRRMDYFHFTVRSSNK